MPEANDLPHSAVTPLSVKRLFSDPPLRPPLPQQAKFSPDGRLISFLSGAPEAREQLELHRYDIEAGTSSRWHSGQSLRSAAGERVLIGTEEETAAERAERERRRQFATGIISQRWFPDSARLLLPLDGAAYELDEPTGVVRRRTPAGTRQTDIRISPDENWLSYVRDGDLHLLDLATDAERQLTEGGGPSCTHGMADFIAQEEMHRFDGHWWSPDSRVLVFQRTDTAHIPESHRYEFSAGGLQVIPQRYPFAGADNARIDLGWYQLDERTHRWLAWQDDDEEYLARVNWLGSRLFIQTQTRDQQCLRLKVFDPAGNRFLTVLEERAATWINLEDNFLALDDGSFLWTAERGSTRQIYRQQPDEDGYREQALTSGNLHVDQMLCVREDQLYFAGWQGQPTERHLFRLPLSGGTPTRLTAAAGWHEVDVCRHSGRILDRWSSLTQPPALDLLDPAGATLARLAGGPITAEHPYFPNLAQHVTPELGTLTAEDGQSLHYRLTRPRGEGPFPVVVNVYGGPGVQRVRQEWAPLELQLFASRGIGVLELDNRGSGNRGAAFEAPIYRELGAVEVRDQLVGVAFLKSLPWVDARRIGVFGHSYGGYMALMCLAKHSETFSCAVSVAPVTDWRWYDTHYTERYLRTPEDNPEGYARSAVFAHLDGLARPLLIIHGMADDNVLFNHSTELFLALQQRDIPFAMMTYPGSKHALQESHVAIHRYHCLLDFFCRHLAITGKDGP